MNHAGPAQSWMSFVIPIVIIAVVMTLRMRSMSKERPLKLEQLWIVPGIYLVIAGLIYWSTPPKTPVVWAACAAALAVGAALGWQRGRLMHIHVDPETQTLRQKASLAAMAFLLVLIAVRTGAREAALFGGLPLDVTAITDVLLALALGLLTVQRIEMYLRAKRLLEEARPA